MSVLWPSHSAMTQRSMFEQSSHARMALVSRVSSEAKMRFASVVGICLMGWPYFCWMWSAIVVVMVVSWCLRSCLRARLYCSMRYEPASPRVFWGGVFLCALALRVISMM